MTSSTPLAPRADIRPPMKIAYLVNRYPKTSHSFIRREIHALEEAGVEIVRVSIRPPGDDLVDPRDVEEARRTHVLFESGSQLVLALLRGLLRVPLRFLRTAGRAIALARGSDRGAVAHVAYLAEARLLVELCRREGVTHVHAHFGTNPPVVALLAAGLGGPGYSFTVHGPEEFDRPRRLKLREKIAGARFVVAISSFGRSQLNRWSDAADWKKIHVVRCGVDEAFLDAEASAPPQGGTPRLVCVGRLCEQKGQLLLVEAVARLAESGADFELVLVGDGELRQAVEGRARELGVAERVRVTGWMGGDGVRAEILAARALVLPSFAEGLPVVLMEALALHRPVISTYVAGIPELVAPRGSDGTDDACGWLVPAGDVDALVDAMRAALDAPRDVLAALGARGAERVRANHDARAESAELLTLFRENA